jgi:hypothetical protein
VSDYFSNFNDWKNTTGAESVHSSGQDGDYASHIIGSNWTYQDGDVTWYQTGNMGYKQIGVSNSLIEGFSFFTVLGVNINDTVGVGIDNYAGIRVGIHGGLALDVNVAAAVRVSYGPYYEWDKTKEYRLTENRLVAVDEDAEFATSVKDIVATEIQTIAGQVTTIIAGMASEQAVVKKIDCTTSYTLTAPAVTLDGPASLTAKTLGDLTLTSGTSLKMLGLTASLNFLGLIKLG